MTRSLRFVVPALAVGLVAPLVLSASAGAGTVRTSGSGRSFDVGWTEYDPDDLLGLPGNVHVGYLYAEEGPYGSYVYGSVSDFDCDDGEVPWGWGGHGVVEDIADEAADAVTDATEDAIDEVIESGASSIDAGELVEAVGADLADELPAVTEDEFVEYPACDYLQDRFLDGNGTAALVVNVRSQTARLTGTLTVSHGGGHGEVGPVLGTPPVDITISGGDWEKYEYSWSSRGATYSWSDSQAGTRYYGGAVKGRIGAMGLADDADDTSYGGFGTYRYRTVERIR